jgi:hypothetical protein
MKALKIIKWLTIILITPWLVFMILAIFNGGEIFNRMGESVVAEVQDITHKLSAKADMIKAQADEWREKWSGTRHAEQKAEESKAKDEKAPAKKSKKTRSSQKTGGEQ